MEIAVSHNNIYSSVCLVVSAGKTPLEQALEHVLMLTRNKNTDTGASGK